MKNKKIIVGILSAVTFFVLLFMLGGKLEGWKDSVFQLVCVLLLCISITCFFPYSKGKNVSETKRGKVNLFSLLVFLVAVPITIYIGIYHLYDKKYYFISVMIILETLATFFFSFEKRKPQARDIVVISVLCAAAVFGRTAFSMLSQVKPVAAIVIVTGACFGAEVGFLTGSLSAFCSNFFFSQGAWTPWQMFAFGILGFLAGVVFRRGVTNKITLSAFGGISVFLLYGGIMNLSSVLMWQPYPTKEMFYITYTKGAVFDLIHAIATVIFLYFIAEPLAEKLERIKVKYGIMEKR